MPAVRAFTVLVSLTLLATPADAWAKPKKKRIAVLELDNGGARGELDALGKGLQSMLTTDLAVVPSFQLIERGRLNDIQTELGRARSKAFDKKSVAKVGKLVGASHLVIGSFAVVGEEMRIDCRLAAVKTGKVVLATQVTGARKTFFQLQKTLAQRLVNAIGTTLSGDVKAKLNVVHTENFDAFERYSRGVQAYDDGAFDRAVEEMSAAAALDTGFSLAKLTAAQYEQALVRLEKRADAVELLSQRRRRRAQNAKARKEYEQEKWLLAVAKRVKKVKAKKLKAPAVAAMARAALVAGYKAHFQLMRRTEDQFALDRLAEAHARTYMKAAQKLYPKVPLEISKAAEAAFSTDSPEAAFKTGAVVDMGHIVTGARIIGIAMNLDTRERLKLMHRLLELTEKKLKPKKRSPEQVKALSDRWLRLAGSYARYGNLDPSTKLAVKLADTATAPMVVRDLKRLVTRNKKTAEDLRTGSPEVRALKAEWVVARGPSALGSLARFMKKGGAGSVEVLHQLNRTVRGFSSLGKVHINGHPVWVLDGSTSVNTDRRTDVASAGALRYYPIPRSRKCRDGEKVCRPNDMLVIAGATPVSTFKASFTLDYRPAADWWMPTRNSKPKPTAEETWASKKVREGYVAGRPSVGFIFGAKDIDVRAERKPDRSHVHHFMRAFSLVVGDGVVTLSRVVDNRPFAGYSFVETPIKTWKVEAANGPTVAVEVAVDGKQLTVKVGETTLKHTLPSRAHGFRGIHAYGNGYVQIGKLTL